MVQAADSPSTQEAARAYRIAAGSLVSVLNSFAEQSGMFIAGHNSLAAGKTSPGLNGSYTPTSGLQHLLQGSGLQAVPQGNNSYVLEPVPANTGALELGAELLSILDKLPADAAHDRELVDAWAAAIGMTGWYTWIPYKP